MLTSQTMLNSSLNVWGVIIDIDVYGCNNHITVIAYNWWCNHKRLIFEYIPKFVQKEVYFHYQRWLLWSRLPDDMWPAWSNHNVEGKTEIICRIIGKDNSRYLTFHNGGYFNIDCNVNTTIVNCFTCYTFATCLLRL